MLATLSTGTGIFTATFDRPLQPGFSASASWSGVRGPLGVFREMQFGVPLTIAGSTVTDIPGTGFIPFAGPQRVSYAAAPADVISTTGAPAAAFIDFPVATIP